VHWQQNAGGRGGAVPGGVAQGKPTLGGPARGVAGPLQQVLHGIGSWVMLAKGVRNR